MDLTQSSGLGIFRLYNPNSGEHFYTADRNEKDGLIAAGWNFEGLAGMPQTRHKLPFIVYITKMRGITTTQPIKTK
ncbi:hypothetical protein EVA_18563 [gut metagenome]|uniref:DUF5648 domain-containing protein n=1 Tax=gut metagenome TaxID=749906 RepID=J9FEI8_9ZZZZ